MANSTGAARSIPFQSLRDQLDQKNGLPFLDLLSPGTVARGCLDNQHVWRERIYTPWITLGVFLSQVLSADKSCDDAVSQLQKYRHDRGLEPIGPDASS